MTNRSLNHLLSTLCFFLPFLLSAQITFNANTQAPPAYNGTFRIGMNLGTPTPSYSSDEALSTLAYNVGARTVRPQLPESFTTQWGYNIRVAAFNFYKNTNGMQDITCMIGMDASAGLRASDTYTCGTLTKQSLLFRDMYLPIWDGGANGTPYNDANPYAVYLYNLVNTYKSYVKFWEVWNEPGLDYASKGWRPAGDPAGNWWDTNPNPCDYKLQAPIFHYIRLLRISYEIVKYLDPTAYVGPSSCGYPSFLDALLRNTDNPVDGSVTATYPNKGGAFFDVICHHAYPHFDGSVKRPSNTPPYQVYSRHSDMAADGLDWVIGNFETVYNNRGYNGVTYPKKKWVISECNLPRESFSPNLFGEVHNFGSDEVQRNFWPKAWVRAVKTGILQIHPFSLVDRKAVSETGAYEFDKMGMYRLGAVNGDPTTKTDGAVSLNTTSLQLFNKTFDATKTAAMNLPSTVNGAAFSDGSGNFTYVIWAKTTTDRSEVASATYSFPATFNIGNMTKRAWDNSLTNTTATVSSQNITLTGSPIFLNVATFVPVELVTFTGKVEKNRHILSWKTASEVNSDYFEVEKSTDGQNFGPLSINAKIKASGNTSTPQSYQTTDENIVVGNNYYRLRMVDLDGKEKYSNVINLESSAKFAAKIAPNPFEKTIQIDLNSVVENDKITIELIDVSGRILITKMVETIGKTAQISLDTEGSPAGFYFVRMSNKNDVLQKKIIKN
jgi:Secretion system C-terminal sorting domain